MRCLDRSRCNRLLGNICKMCLITPATKSVIHGFTPFPECHVARIWYDTSTATSFEVLVLCPSSTGSTSPTKPSHASQNVRHFVPLQLSTANRPSLEKETVKIWNLQNTAKHPSPALSTKNKKKQHHRLALAPYARQRKWLTPNGSRSSQAIPIASKHNGARGRKKLLFSTANWGQSQNMGPSMRHSARYGYDAHAWVSWLVNSTPKNTPKNASSPG